MTALSAQVTQYTTFLGAIADTVAGIHNGDGPQQPVNSFIVLDRGDHFYVEGECWSFHLKQIQVRTEPHIFEVRWEVF